MSVIVKGIFGKEMPMPQEGYVDIRLHFKGGRIECATMPTGNPPYYAIFKVAELPSHGRLIDADALHDAMYHRAFETDGDTMWQSGCWVRYRAIEQIHESQPTIIDAEGSEE